MTRVVICLLLSSVMLVLAGCTGSSPSKNAPADEKIRIGAFMSLTGDTGQYGISAMTGMQMAVEDANGRGGIHGRRVELIVQDTRSNLDETRAVVRRLIDNMQVHALLGEIVSSRSIAAAEVAQEARVPMLTPSSTSPGVTTRGDYIFRSSYTDPFQGAAISQFAARGLGARRAAMLLDGQQEYALKLAQFIREDFIRRGGEVVVEQTYAEGDSYFTSQLEAIKAAQPDVIFLPGYYREAGLIAREAKQLGLTAPLVGGDGWDSHQLYEIGEQALLGSFFSSHYSAEDADPVVRQFVSAYLHLYGKLPDAFAATAYDATRIMLDAFERTGSTDRTVIRDALARTNNFPGVTGIITFNQNRDAIKSIVIIKIEEGGRYAVQERISPESLIPEPTPTPTPPKRRKRRGR